MLRHASSKASANSMRSASKVRELIVDESGECVTNLAVVIVTWRDHVYTAACLHSLLASKLRPRWVVVVDNGSGDQTSQHLHEYLAGKRVVVVHEPFSDLDVPLSASDHAESLGYIVDDSTASVEMAEFANKTLVRLISASNNGGFASGNNIGIRYLEQAEYEGCIWLLNNDAYVAPECIGNLVLHGKRHSLPELFGTALVEYHEPKKIQALGGMLSKQMLSPKNNRSGAWLADVAAQENVVTADYPVGASMLTWADRLYGKRQPLFEGYFLYYEEADLCAELGISDCPIYVDAVVAHVGGVTTGDVKLERQSKRSFSREYYGTRARVIYCRRYAVEKSIYVVLFCMALIFKRIVTFELWSSKTVSRGFFNGLRYDLHGSRLSQKDALL